MGGWRCAVEAFPYLPLLFRLRNGPTFWSAKGAPPLSRRPGRPASEGPVCRSLWVACAEALPRPASQTTDTCVET